MKRLKRVALIGLSALLAFAGAPLALPVSAAKAAETTVGEQTLVNAEAALTFDLESGQVLYAKNIDEPRPIASLTKLIVVDLVLDAIKRGDLKWDDTVAATPSIAALTQDKSLANVAMRPGERYTVKELYEATLIESANSAAMLLGNAVSGSQAKFIDKMRAKLKSWGIKDATIVTISGLDNNALAAGDRYPGSLSADVNKMSARDYAKVVTRLLDDHPDVLETTKMTEATFAKGTPDATAMTSFNKMLPGLEAAQADLPVDGLKTGTSDGAGPSFAGTLKLNNRRLVTIVLHANGTSSTTRFEETAKMLRAVQNTYAPRAVATKNSTVKGIKALNVPNGESEKVPLVAAQDAVVYVPKAVKTPKWNVSQKSPKEAHAPLKKGAPAGVAHLSAKGVSLDYLDRQKGASVFLKTKRANKEANIFVKAWRGVTSFFSNLF